MLETATNTELKCHYANARAARAEAFAQIAPFVRALFTWKRPQLALRPLNAQAC